MKPTWNQLRPIAAYLREREEAARELTRQHQRERERLERRQCWSPLQKAFWHATHCQKVRMGGHWSRLTDEIRQFFVDRYIEEAGIHPLECGCEEVE